MNIFIRSIVAVFLLTSSVQSALADNTCQTDAELKINDQKAQIQLAIDERTRRYGLMFRASMGENCGMLFVFESTRPRVFTMRNTLIPLDIAFIDEEGRIAEIFSMEPGGDRYPSSVPARFALEMNKDWFATNKISVGDLIEVVDAKGELLALKAVIRLQPQPENQ